jgi:sugar phosphate isomerase/epimerase
MAEEVSNLVLEQLRHIRSGVDALRETIADHGVRLSAIEEHTGQELVQLAALNERMDRSDERLSRIERRLELAEA